LPAGSAGAALLADPVDRIALAKKENTAMKVSTGLALALCLSALASAQTPEQKPTPSAEQKRLGYFVGTWTQEAEMKAGPMGPGGKITGSETCEWFTGGFHIVCRSAGKGPMGDFKALGFMNYDGEEKAYFFHGIDSMGMADSGKGVLDGRTWTYLSDSKIGGKTVHSRYVMTEISPTSYSAKWDTSEDGQNWSTVMEMKAVKAPAKN
jgi:hypothetical protein